MTDTAARLRIDVWLWRARFFKTRALAAAAIAKGVYLEHAGRARRIDKPATMVEPGDGLSFRCGARLRTLRIEGLGARRGPATEARLLYQESADTLDDPSDDAHSDAQSEDNPRS